MPLFLSILAALSLLITPKDNDITLKLDGKSWSGSVKMTPEVMRWKPPVEEPSTLQISFEDSQNQILITLTNYDAIGNAPFEIKTVMRGRSEAEPNFKPNPKEVYLQITANINYKDFDNSYACSLPWKDPAFSFVITKIDRKNGLISGKFKAELFKNILNRSGQKIIVTDAEFVNVKFSDNP
jgi:hypothetical protein